MCRIVFLNSLHIDEGMFPRPLEVHISVQSAGEITPRKCVTFLDVSYPLPSEELERSLSKPLLSKVLNFAPKLNSLKHRKMLDIKVLH